MSAASHTPFESTHRVFVLERADTMNDEAANALLKTLEEPPSYVVLLLLTDNPSQVLPTISSRCQPVRFDPLPAAELATKLQARGIDPETATACARLSLGDGERALTLALDPRAARPHRGLRPRAAARPGARRPGLAPAARPGPQRRCGRQARGRGRARRGAPVPAQEGAPQARDRVHRARPPRRAPRDDRRARARAPARRPLVPRPRLRRRRRRGARPPQRPARRPARGRGQARRRRLAHGRRARRRHARRPAAQRQRGAGARGARLPPRGLIEAGEERVR